MELTELLQRRLKIALNAAQTDPANSDSIKAVLSVLTECLWHHSTALELAESELAGKVSDAEFKRALSGKLSVKEFLGYFQKIERVVEKMENYWSSNEQKTAQMLQRQRQKLHQQLADAIQARISECTQRLQTVQSKTSQISNQMQKISLLQCQIVELSKKTKWFHEQLSKKQATPKQQLQQQKMKAVLTGLRQMQSYFNQSQYQIRSLLQSVIQSGVSLNSNNNNYQKMEVLDLRIIRCEEILPNRWTWEWNTHSQEFIWQSRAGRKNIAVQKIQQNINKLTIKNGGFYKLTLGYLIENEHYGSIRISCNNRILCTINLQGNGSSCLCKTTMLYSWVPNQAVIVVEIDNCNNTRGFLQIQNFD